ncbi:MAG TPA: DUF3450 family protein [Verrucomicrobiae bacterium]
MKWNTAVLGFLCGFAVTLGGHAQEQIADTRSALQKWVETRQMTSKLRADWAAERELLQESIKMFERESKNLDELIAKVDTGNEVARKEQAEQQKLEAEYKIAIERVKSLLDHLEKKTVTLAKTFPPPLAEKLDGFVKRIPEDPAATKLSAGQRMQALVAILAEADKFNGAISVVSELRKNAAGAEVQVRTMYLGLAQAYYADKSGQLAGVGLPSAEGWKWSDEPSLAPAIIKVIAIHESEQPVSFVTLPVKIQ